MNVPKPADLQLLDCLRDRARSLLLKKPAKRIGIIINDHYEPLAGGVPAQIAGAFEMFHAFSALIQPEKAAQ